jgi:ribonucleoside-diphosphate reductase alpha chain
MENIQSQESRKLTLKRHFTDEDLDVFDVDYEMRNSVIRNPDGSVVAEIKDIEVPKAWSQVATDILAQKYFRKAGIPKIESETSVKEVVKRMSGCWRFWGETNGYFASKKDAEIYEQEMQYMVLHQMAAPNSPQWFNTGLNWAYGLTGSPQGHFYYNEKTKTVEKSVDTYSRPQPHACADYHTNIYTENGIKYIGEIVEKDLTGIKVFDGEKYVKILAVKYNGKKTVYRIKLKNGNYIELTEDHLVLGAEKRHKDGGIYDWLPVSKLSLGMRMQQPLLLDIKEKNIFSDELAKARLAGWIVGDGSVGIYNNVMRLEVITINSDEHDAVLNDIHEIFGKDVAYWITSFETQNADIDGKRIHLAGKKIENFINDYNLLQRSNTAKTPKKIVYGSPQEKREFIKALFQADGCVRIRISDIRNSGDVCLTTSSETLAFETLQTLNSLGIYARLSINIDKRENRKGTTQVIIAYGSARESFQQQIGFIGKLKNSKLAQLQNCVINSKSLPLIREESIVSIEEMGIRDVYDIQTESGKFLGNGIVIHNCFIQRVKDDLVNEGGIFDLVTREARLFKYGSGTGTNFSTLRGEGEPLSGGGKSSGLMSWLRILDRAAGAIKSGGTTRRAAKMVCLDLDHPDIEKFITWKMYEEQKVADLVSGSKMCSVLLNNIMSVAKDNPDINSNPKLTVAIKAAVKANVPPNYIFRVLQLTKHGKTSIDFPVFDTHYESDAYNTVSGQNSNNSVRIPNSYMDALEKDADWKLIFRTTGETAKTLKARDLWDNICFAAWSCADPGVQYDTTINEWHTCPAAGKINASNPCSEYMFLDDTACNLASINLVKFLDDDVNFKVDSFLHAVKLWTITLEISVLMAQFPSKPMAELSYLYRTLGLGYANIGSMLMRMGIPYDSDKGRAIGGAISSLMTGKSYETSAEIAKALGSFIEFDNNKESMLQVIKNHRAAAYDSDDYTNITIKPQGIDKKLCPEYLLKPAQKVWDDALEMGEKYGYRNAQVTVLAPTGTIGLLMDCDTTGVEPDFALVKFKKLAGGGYFKIVNQGVPSALKTLGYKDDEIKLIIDYCVGYGTLVGCPGINNESLKEKGFDEATIKKIETQLASAFDLKFVFNKFTIGDELCKKLGFNNKDLNNPNFNMLGALGFTDEQISIANEYIGGTMTIEGAPGLKDEHLPVFDCANRCGINGKRYIKYMGHIKFMAAAQPFISGAISKTINMPNEATIEDISIAYTEAWKLMVKAVALYRDGSKLSQPLNTITESKELNALIVSEVDDSVGPEQVHNIAKRSLPSEYKGIREEVTVGGTPVILQTAEFEDGTLGEVKVDVHKYNNAYGELMEQFAEAVSIALQYGIPLEEFVEKFTFSKSEVGGLVQGHDNIKNATSAVDFIFRSLAFKYNDRNDLVHVNKDKKAKESTIQKINEALDEITMAKAKGYTGDKCSNCGSMRLRRNGTCAVCDDCGMTTGCS